MVASHVVPSFTRRLAGPHEIIVTYFGSNPRNGPVFTVNVVVRCYYRTRSRTPESGWMAGGRSPSAGPRDAKGGELSERSPAARERRPGAGDAEVGDGLPLRD